MQVCKQTAKDISQLHSLSNIRQAKVINKFRLTDKMNSNTSLQESLALTSISDLWGKLIALYGRAFTQQYGVEIDKEGIWNAALSFVTPEKLTYGFKKLLMNNQFKVFPPNPFQFRELCEVSPDSQYLPSSKDALIEARNYFSLCAHDKYIWSHPVVKFCAAKLGREAFETVSPRDLAHKFITLYEKACMAHKQGLPLTCTIANAPFSEPNKRVGNFYLSKIKSQLGVN